MSAAEARAQQEAADRLTIDLIAEMTPPLPTFAHGPSPYDDDEDDMPVMSRAELLQAVRDLRAHLAGQTTAHEEDDDDRF